MTMHQTISEEEAEFLIDAILNQPGEWIDVYNPEIHGSLDEWVEMRARKKAAHDDIGVHDD